MQKEQELDTEKISVYFELITEEDSRYEDHREAYPVNYPEEKPVLPIVDVDVSDISPFVSAKLERQTDEYMENNPELIHSIISCEEKNILESYPIDKPHSEEIKVCDVYVTRTEDNILVVSEFDFEDLMELCS